MFVDAVPFALNVDPRKLPSLPLNCMKFARTSYNPIFDTLTSSEQNSYAPTEPHTYRRASMLTIDELRTKRLLHRRPNRTASATWVITQVCRNGMLFTDALAEMHESPTNFNELCLMIRGAMFSGPDSMEPVWRARYEIVKRQWQECTR